MFVDELRKNPICNAIMTAVDGEDREDIKFTFTVHEALALHKAAFYVYNSFCNDSNENDCLSKEMNHFLEDLASGIEKLNNL